MFNALKLKKSIVDSVLNLIFLLLTPFYSINVNYKNTSPC
ncbi:hypothetical protein FM106_07650 [Brachybacterium faecium]|nr:hypothetical protein FM106_07650 [Brachybacterium faecium]